MATDNDRIFGSYYAPRPLDAVGAYEEARALRASWPDAIRERMAREADGTRAAFDQSVFDDIRRTLTALATAAPAVPTEPVETPVAVKVDAMEIDAEYLAACHSLGFSTPEIRRQKLEAFMAEEGICAYPEDKVNAYMNQIVAKEGKAGLHWYWRPMRAADVSNSVGEKATPYDKPIPLPVLLTAQKLNEKFPGELAFHVTDYKVKRPDPFLSVSLIGDSKRYIIERWDEPGFRM